MAWSHPIPSTGFNFGFPMVFPMTIMTIIAIMTINLGCINPCFWAMRMSFLRSSLIKILIWDDESASLWSRHHGNSEEFGQIPQSINHIPFIISPTCCWTPKLLEFKVVSISFPVISKQDKQDKQVTLHHVKIPVLGWLNLRLHLCNWIHGFAGKAARRSYTRRVWLSIV